jgi:hypothetical protein
VSRLLQRRDGVYSLKRGAYFVPQSKHQPEFVCSQLDRLRHADLLSKRRVVGVDRKCPADGRNDELDPYQTSIRRVKIGFQYETGHEYCRYRDHGRSFGTSASELTSPIRLANSRIGEWRSPREATCPRIASGFRKGRSMSLPNFFLFNENSPGLRGHLRTVETAVSLVSTFASIALAGALAITFEIGEAMSESAESLPLRLEAKVPLDDVRGRIDHMAICTAVSLAKPTLSINFSASHARRGVNVDRNVRRPGGDQGRQGPDQDQGGREGVL